MTAEIEMIEVEEGTAVYSTMTFTVGTAAVDPETVTCTWTLPGETPTIWTYGGEGTENIAQLAAGEYRVRIPTTGVTAPGAIRGTWRGRGNTATRTRCFVILVGAVTP